MTPAELEAQARRDLDELEEQVAAGEIDLMTAEDLRRRYERDLEDAQQSPGDATTSRSTPRSLVGAGLLVLGLGVAIAVVGSTAEPTTDGNLQGAASGEFDPESYSDETLEAVIAASADDPAVADQLPRMRFALAERYFEENRFQEAFQHYQAILEGEPPADLFAATMTRLAWITFVGNGEVDLALGLVDRAIDAAPASTESIYVKGQILWCGAGDAAAAVPLFELVLSSDALSPEVRSQVAADLDRASAGEDC